MNESSKTMKYVVGGLVAAVVILLLVVAFLLGQRSGAKKDPDATAYAPTQPVNTAETTAPTASEPAGTTAPAATVPAATAPDGTTVPPATVPPVYDPAVAFNAPRNLEISMSAGSLTFVEGAAFDVRYDADVIRVDENGESMTIENSRRHPSASERRRMNVTVTVPAGCAFDSVNVEFGAGKLIVHSLIADALHMELGAGSATFDDLTVTGSAEIQEGAGELAIKSGTIANLTLRCGAGATRVSAALTGASRIDAAVGAVDLNFRGSEADYTVAFQMGLGACYYNNEKIARNGAFGEGPNRVDINGGFGVMRVNVR